MLSNELVSKLLFIIVEDVAVIGLLVVLDVDAIVVFLIELVVALRVVSRRVVDLVVVSVVVVVLIDVDVVFIGVVVVFFVVVLIGVVVVFFVVVLIDVDVDVVAVVDVVDDKEDGDMVIVSLSIIVTVLDS